MLLAISKVCEVSIDYIITGEDFSSDGIDLNKSLVASYPEVAHPKLQNLLKSFDMTLSNIRSVTESMLTLTRVEEKKSGFAQVETRIDNDTKRALLNDIVLMK